MATKAKKKNDRLDSDKICDLLRCDLLRELLNHPRLQVRVQQLRTIEGVGEVLGLSWALEVGEVERFGSIGRAVSYCGLCSRQ